MNALNDFYLIWLLMHFRIMFLSLLHKFAKFCIIFSTLFSVIVLTFVKKQLMSNHCGTFASSVSDFLCNEKRNYGKISCYKHWKYEYTSIYMHKSFTWIMIPNLKSIFIFILHRWHSSLRSVDTTMYSIVLAILKSIFFVQYKYRTE